MGIRDPYVLTRDGMKVPTYEGQHDNLTTVRMAPCRCESIEWVCAAWAREHTAELRASASVDIPALRKAVEQLREMECPASRADHHQGLCNCTELDVLAESIEKALKGGGSRNE